jgi:hypothetical protein
MWKWISAIWAALMLLFGKYKEIKAEEEVERKEHYEDVQREVADEIKEKHEEVVNSADPNATIDKQLSDLDLTK